MVLRLDAEQPCGRQIDAVQLEISRIIGRPGALGNDHAKPLDRQHRRAPKRDRHVGLHGPGVDEAPVGQPLDARTDRYRGAVVGGQSSAEAAIETPALAPPMGLGGQARIMKEGEHRRRLGPGGKQGGEQRRGIGDAARERVVGAIENGDQTGGRFLVRANRVLEDQIFRTDRPVTVAGNILGRESRALDETTYDYPVISLEEYHLWPEAGSYEDSNPRVFLNFGIFKTF